MKLHLLILILLFCSCNTTLKSDIEVNPPHKLKKGDVFVAKIENDKKISIVLIDSPLNDREKRICNTNLLLIAKLCPELRFPPNKYDNVYWGEMTNYLALTIWENKNHKKGAYIILDKTIKPNREKPNIFDNLFFTSILRHEYNHAYFDTKDPETGKLTDEKILNSVLTSIVKPIKVEDRKRFGGATNLFQKYLFECDIPFN